VVVVAGLVKQVMHQQTATVEMVFQVLLTEHLQPVVVVVEQECILLAVREITLEVLAVAGSVVETEELAETVLTVTVEALAEELTQIHLVELVEAE
jgi:hypothetical protein